MVFATEGQFQQFPHCKFRENVVRLLYIPSIHSIRPDSVEEDAVDKSPNKNNSPSHFFLSINKYGKVGLYHPERFCLIHTYCLDLSVPMHPKPHPRIKSSPTTNPPKCERTHLVIDATFAPDALCVIFATTKNLLQWYDIGEIQRQNIGLELFPRKEFMGLLESSFPLLRIPNQGHVESHRLFGLPFMPTCLEYFCGDGGGGGAKGKLFIGDVDGGISILSMPNPRYPLGRRKIRGKLHKIMMPDLMASGYVLYYKAHHQPVTDIYYLSERELVLSCSKDKKFSVFVKDIKETVDSIIVSVTRGVNTIAYSSALKMIATGSDDHVVRLFSQFIMKMPQMELFGHRSAVLTVHFAQVDASIADDVEHTGSAEEEENPTLLFSYSADSELRAWDPLTFICLQSLYLNFPIGSTIICKTPEFSRKSLIIHQLDFQEASDQKEGAVVGNNSKKKTGKGHGKAKCGKTGNKSKQRKPVGAGTIILLYCNSFARVQLEQGRPSRWPLDYDQFIQEFEELSMEYEKKLKEKLKVTTLPSSKEKSASAAVIHSKPDEKVDSRTSTTIREEEDDNLDGEVHEKLRDKRFSGEEMSEIESKLDAYVREILELKQTIKDNGEKMAASKGGILRQSSGESRSQVSGAAGRTPRLTIREADGSAEEELLASSPTEAFNISVHATDKFYEFKRAKRKNLPKPLERMITYGQAFNYYRLMEPEPIEFSQRNLVISEEMKRILGIGSVDSVRDLMTPKAQAYFGIDLRKSGSRFFPAKKLRKGGKERCGVGKQGVGEGQASSSLFAVIGQKMRNAYEDDEPFQGDGEEEVEQGGESYKIYNHHNGYGKLNMDMDMTSPSRERKSGDRNRKVNFGGLEG